MNSRQETALEHWRRTGVILPGAQSVVARHRGTVAKTDGGKKAGYCATCGARSSRLGECPVCGDDLMPVEVDE